MYVLYMNRMGYKTVKGNTFSTIAIKDILMNPSLTRKYLVRWRNASKWKVSNRNGFMQAKTFLLDCSSVLNAVALWLQAIQGTN